MSAEKNSFALMISKNLMTYVGVPGIIIVIIAVIYHCRIINNKYVTTLGTFSVLYFLGKFIQVFHDIPAIFRWYLADVGWVPLWTYVSLIVNIFGSKKTISQIVTVSRICTLCGMAIASFVEILTSWIKQEIIRQGKIYKGVVGGDPIDIVIYITMYFVSFYLLKKSIPRLQSRFE